MARRAAILASCLLTAAALTGPPALAADPEPWLTELSFPVNMAWAPDGTLFYAEKETGDVRLVEAGRLAPEPVAHVDVVGSFETGLLGIEVDPDWPDEPWLYLYYSDAADETNRLIRVRIAGGREVARETLLDGLPTVTAYHNGGDLVFGRDGMLYLTVGEAHQIERAQDPGDIGGKVLRLTREGDVPDDNPIEGSRAYTLGHRNSFGICLDPETGELWETENGPSGGDEVNHLVAGANYGWPEGTGPLEDERFTDPVVHFPDTIVPTGCAIWRGALYVGSYGDGLLRRFSLDPPAEERSRVAGFDEPVLDVAAGPDDRLYVATATAIWRLDEPPTSVEPDDGAVRGAGANGDAGAGGAMPGWILPAIGVLLAVALLATLLSARRR